MWWGRVVRSFFSTYFTGNSFAGKGGCVGGTVNLLLTTIVTYNILSPYRDIFTTSTGQGDITTFSGDIGHVMDRCSNSRSCTLGRGDARLTIRSEVLICTSGLSGDCNRVRGIDSSKIVILRFTSSTSTTDTLGSLSTSKCSTSCSLVTEATSMGTARCMSRA